ncbi:MAG: hypothetical protein IPG66_00545 [Hydrogenophilales bacterium]|nr:hypothetical protein [Hydrogenophilales bacterium]
MTQDFRQPGPHQASVGQERSQLDPGRRVVLLSLYASSFAFLLAGVWLLVGEQSLLSADIASIVGAALIITALSDVVVVAVLKRLWFKNTPRR